MLGNYLLTAYRNLIRNKFFSVINMGGLALGMAACLLIAQYVTFEKSFDSFHEESDNIYRVVNVRHYPTHTDESAGCPTPLGPGLKENFPEVKSFARCYKSERILSFDDRPVHFTKVFTVDSSFLDIFSFPVINGPLHGLLSQPNTAVFTQSAAKNMFGDKEPVGQTILLGNIPYVVEAVLADVPENSHMQFEVLLSLVTELNSPDYCIGCNNRNTYIVLDENANASALEAKLPELVKKFHGEESFRREYKLQPLRSIHLYSHLRFEHEQNGNAQSVLALTIVAALILFIAWLNYVNLTTSMAMKRSVEVGIRKVNGSTRRNLVFQFLTESLLVNLMAAILALLLAELAYPAFKSLVGIQSPLTIFTNFNFWIGLLGTILFGSIVYGFYPAFVVSGFKPIQAIKGKSLLPKSAFHMRQGLVLLQFTVSIILVAGTITVYRQILFMKKADLGISIDGTIAIPVPPEYRERQIDLFANELSTNSSVRNITYTTAVPGEENGSVGGGFHAAGAPPENEQQVYTVYVRNNYFDFFSIRMIAGSAFTGEPQNPGENRTIIINDAARKAFGFDAAEDAIGKIIYQGDFAVGQVVGVTADHHTRSLDNVISPNLFINSYGKSYYMIKVNPETAAENLPLIEAAFTKAYANNPFEYFFLDEFFNRQYSDYTQFGKIFGIFTILAIVIACLGLSGLSLYIIRVRIMEITLRKVLGASAGNILRMLSLEYIKLTVAAFVVGAPVGWYLIQQWLTHFPYHITLDGWMLFAPGVFVLMIVLITITAQSMKTALANPSKGLRNE